MHNPRFALALGQFDAAGLSLLEQAAKEAAFSLRVAASAQDASNWLDENQPLVMLVDTASVEPESIALKARAEARHSQVPVLALAHEVDDLGFASAFAWGADDLVLARDEHALVGRLRRLPREAPVPPAGERGVALVAEPEKLRRLLLGRVLRDAGYAVRFAVTQEDAQQFAQDPEVKLAVLHLEFCGDAAKLVATVRGAGSKAHLVLHAPPREMKALAKALGSEESVAVADGFSPPENVLFTSNELVGGRRFDQRASPRLLYGTTVAFRGAGRQKEDLGYSYNVSAGGLYVRTLFPPDDDKVWLELTAPRSEWRVRLEGTVAWRRLLGPQQQATVPPGFGVRISDATKAELLSWEEGYGALREVLS